MMCSFARLPCAFLKAASPLCAVTSTKVGFVSFSGEATGCPIRNTIANPHARIESSKFLPRVGDFSCMCSLRRKNGSGAYASVHRAFERRQRVACVEKEQRALPGYQGRQP